MNCIYHKNGYFKECLSFSFKFKNKLLTWHYRSCGSNDVLFVPICNNCDLFYVGQTEELKQRALRTCSKMKEPHFNIYPFLYGEDKYLREFKERRYIMNCEPRLSSYQ